MNKKYVKLSTMLRSIQESYPISEDWRKDILEHENIWVFAVLNCNGGRVVNNRDFLFGWRRHGAKARWFTVTERDSPTEHDEFWDVTPISRDDAVELCFLDGSSVLYKKSKSPPPIWAYNFIVSVCQLTKESTSFTQKIF